MANFATPFKKQLIYMKQTNTRWLLTAILLLCSHGVWAQALPAADNKSMMLEISDCYGDKQTVPLAEGMTLFWPQNPDFDQRTHVVLTDKDGKPCLAFPFNYQDFAFLKFLNPPTAGESADMSRYREPDNYSNVRLRFDIDGHKYWLNDPGEIRFNSPLGTYELVLADNQRFTIPIASTEMIYLQDTIQGIGGYLKKMLASDALIYRASFFDTQYLNEDFYAMVPEGNVNFSLLVPGDAALENVPEVISFVSQKPRCIRLEYKDRSFFATATAYQYYPTTGEVSETQYRMERYDDNQIANRLTMMLRSHTIMHNRPEDMTKGLESGNEYYLALDGSPIRVIRTNGKPTAVQGAFQMWNQEAGRTTFTQANLGDSRRKGNGIIYIIDQYLNATPRTVYDVLSGKELGEGEVNPYSKFFELCQGAGSFFISNGGLTEGNDLNFAGNIPFTLYVPTNEAIEQELAAHPLATQADTLNFVKAHLQFGIEIADQLPFSRNHRTVLVKDGSLATPSLQVEGLGNGKMSVTDECGNMRNVIDSHKNIFVREVSCSMNNKITSPVGRTSLNNLNINSYATGVIHQIDGVLKYKP